MAIPQKNEDRLMTGEELARHPELQPCETLGIGDTLRDEEVLPGFSLPLSELFRDQPASRR